MATGNEIRAIRVNNITVNLNNVTHVTNSDFFDHKNEQQIYVLTVYFQVSRPVVLYQGEQDVRDALREYIDATFGQFLDLSNIINTDIHGQPRKETDETNPDRPPTTE